MWPPFLDRIAISAFRASTSCACSCTSVCSRWRSSMSFLDEPDNSCPYKTNENKRSAHNNPSPVQNTHQTSLFGIKRELQPLRFSQYVDHLVQALRVCLNQINLLVLLTVDLILKIMNSTYLDLIEITLKIRGVKSTRKMYVDQTFIPEKIQVQSDLVNPDKSGVSGVLSGLSFPINRLSRISPPKYKRYYLSGQGLLLRYKLN